MRQILIILLFFFSITEIMYAQSYKFEAGIEGGANLANVRNNDYLNQFSKSHITTACGGFFFQYNITHHLSLRTNVFWERKGTKITMQTQPTEDFFDYLYLDYLTIPLLFRVTGGKKFQYFINAGPYMGYLLNQNNQLYHEGMKNSIDNTDKTYKLDYGISGGIGVAVPIKQKFAFSFEVRHNFGLRDVNVLSPYEGGTANLNSTNILAGIIYKFGKK